MEPLSVFIVLLFMAVVLFIPGFAISYVAVPNMELQYRIVFSFVLGVVPIYMVYMLTKDGFMTFNSSGDMAVLFFFIAVVLVRNDARNRIINWLFVKRSV
jgi:hypothetical protein